MGWDYTGLGWRSHSQANRAVVEQEERDQFNGKSQFLIKLLSFQFSNTRMWR